MEGDSHRHLCFADGKTQMERLIGVIHKPKHSRHSFSCMNHLDCTIIGGGGGGGGGGGNSPMGEGGGRGGNSHVLRTYHHSQLYQCSPPVTLQESPPCYSAYNAVSMVQQCLLHGDNHKGRRGEVPVVLSELTPAYTMHDLVMLQLVMIPLYSAGRATLTNDLVWAGMLQFPACLPLGTVEAGFRTACMHACSVVNRCFVHVYKHLWVYACVRTCVCENAHMSTSCCVLPPYTFSAIMNAIYISVTI